MSNTRVYNIYNRNKLPRNKYGILYDLNGVNSSSSSSLFGSDNAANVVGSTDLASLSEFIGATPTEDGYKGLVPTPLAGEQLKFLQATGSWTDIPAYRWLKEFPTSPGLEKSGLTIDGDFNVTKTLSTMDLKVEGAAHFWTLIIDEVKANGGQVMISPSMFHIDFVGDIQYYSIFTEDSIFVELLNARKDIDKMLRACNVTQIKCRRVWCRNDDGNKRTRNEVEVGDMLRCRSFNIKEGVYHNVSNVDYWTFAVNVGEGSFINENDEEHTGFYVDLAFALKMSNGHNLPLNTILKDDGTYILPEGYVEFEEIDDELKRTSQETLTGSRDVEHEIYDNEEYLEIENKVIRIRGIDDQINNLVGTKSMNSLGDNTLDLRQATQQLEFITNGTLTDNADVDDVASLILNGTYNNDGDVTRNGSTLSQAELKSNDVLRKVNLPIEKDMSLIVDRSVESTLVLEDGTVLGRDFIAADDLYNINGEKVYDKGDTILENTIVSGDWKLIDNESIDDVFCDEGGEIVVPENETEIRDFTKDTDKGKDRDSDMFLNKDYSSFTEWLFGYGTFSCSEGDDLACLGHLYNTERSNAIVLSASDPIDPELVAPAMAQYNNIDLFGESISKNRMTAIAANGNEFIGSFLINYNNTYLDVNERINMFITDINSGLEKVGIHLDGDNSKITLVGSVDVKQHSNTSYDTINVYDKFNTKRVEIRPFEIPSRSGSDSNLDITTNQFNYISDTKNATKDYIKYNSWRHWWFWPFNSSMVYSYELSNYTINLTSSINLGQLSVGNSLDLSNLDLKVWGKTYLVGKTLVSDHGTGKQSITTLTYTIKKDGLPISGYNKRSILSDSGLNVSGLNSDEISISLSRTFLNDLTISSAGTYTLEINVVYYIYAYTESYDEYKNYYYKINCGLSGRVKSSVDKSSGSSDDVSGRKMTIGTNGFTFNCNNSRYFYAGSDGYELKWDDTSIRLDSEYGLKETKLYESVSGSKNISKKYDIIIANYSSTGYTLTLPSANEYGVGRKMTIIAFKGLKVVTLNNTDEIKVSTDTSFLTSHTIEFGTGAGTSIVMPKYVVELISINGDWYIVSYF